MYTKLKGQSQHPINYRKYVQCTVSVNEAIRKSMKNDSILI